MDFFKYIHAVGTGKKGNRDLTLEESKDLMHQILNRDVSNEQIAAFLLGWRLKPETITEFKGIVEVCESYVTKQTVKDSIELGYPFDGKVKNPYLFPLIAKFLNTQKLNLVVSGDLLQPAKGGITVQDICKNISLEPNLFYFDRADFFPKMHNLTSIRRNLGLRTGFNTIEKLTNFANSNYAIIGAFHKPYVKKYIEIFSKNYNSFAVIQGNEGTPELFSKGRLWITQNNNTKEYIIDPKYYGIDYKKSINKITLQESLNRLNNPSDNYIKLAHLNAAIYLFIAQKAPTIEDAFDILNYK